MKSEEDHKGQIKHLRVHTPEKVIFWDTSFVVSALFPPNKERIAELTSKKSLSDEDKTELSKLRFFQYRHGISVDFMEKLIKENVGIAFSSILFHEMYFVVKYITIEKAYENSRTKAQEQVKNNPKILDPYIPDILKKWDLFMALLSKFTNRILSITPSDPAIIRETLRVRSKYGLKPDDSFHLGTVLVNTQYRDIIVFDKNFRDAALNEGLNVWYKV